MKKAVIVVFVFVVAAGGYWAYREFWPRRPGETAIARRGVISATVETTGRIQAAKQARLAPQVSGIVQRVYVRPGDAVAEGDLLLELKVPSLERAVRQAELNLEIHELQLAQAKSGGSDADIAIAKARLRQATVVLQAAQEDYDKIKDREDAPTSDKAIALENAKVAFEIAKASFEKAVHGAEADEIEILEKQRELAALTLEGAVEQLSQAQMRAPFAGTVLAVDTKEAQIAHGGNPIITLADLTRLEIVAQIDEIDIGEVSLGQAVEIILDAFPDKRLSGEVVHIAPAAIPQRGSTVYEATISFDNEGLPIRPDMGTNLTIITLEHDHALLVPNRAVQTVGSKKVVRVREGRHVREREVTVGLSNRQESEILDGLREGEVVLLE